MGYMVSYSKLAQRLFGKLDQRLLVEKVDLLFFHLRGVLIGNIGVAFLVIWVLRPVVPANTLMSWFVLVFCISFVRYIITRKVMLIPTDKHNASDRMLFHASFILFSGIVWGIGGLMFMTPQDPGYLAFLLLILAGMVAGCLASYATFPPLYAAYSVPTIVPIATYLIATSNHVVPYAGYFMAAFLAINLFYCRNLGKAINGSLSLQFENLELMEQLREQKEIAESSNIAKSKFLAAASHDLRQPLHALGLFTNTLEQKVNNKQLDSLIGKINLSVEALSSLFHSLLDISKLDAGIVEVDSIDFNISDILIKLRDELEDSAEKKNLRLTIESDNYIVLSDKVLLERILRNLITNAIRYTEKGEVRVTLNNEGESVTVSVEDTGIGIPVDQREAIFSEYHQLNNPERSRQKGLGLGLAIVKRLTDLLGITINLESDESKGSSFSIKLSSGDKTRVLHEKPSNQIWDLTGLKVLVIDDEVDILTGMQEILGAWGCDMVLAVSLQAALEQLKAENMRPDLILSDYRLQNHKTGADAIQGIEDYFDSKIPAILITGDTSSDRLIEAKASGYRLLHKPILPPQLRTAMHQEISNVV